MSGNLKLNTALGGSIALTPENTASNFTVTIPATTGTMNTSGSVNTVPAGTVSAPAITTTGDTNTGIFFPAADTIAFTEGGVESMRIDSSGNVGIGTNSNLASSKLDVRGRIRTGSGNSSGDSEVVWSNYASATSAWTASVRQDVGGANNDLKFLRFDSGGGFTGVTMQLDSAANLLVGTASSSFGQSGFIISPNYNSNASSGMAIQHVNGSSSGSTYASFIYNAGQIGNIAQSGTTSVAYNTTSDYRLKENVQPMQNALATVAALKPVTYTWKADGSAGQGFIAHELQAVVPDCVTGAKDAVRTVDVLDAEGKAIGTKEEPQYQGIDTSFLVATLVAAIQELTARLEVLENK